MTGSDNCSRKQVQQDKHQSRHFVRLGTLISSRLELRPVSCTVCSVVRLPAYSILMQPGCAQHTVAVTSRSNSQEATLTVVSALACHDPARPYRLVLQVDKAVSQSSTCSQSEQCVNTSNGMFQSQGRFIRLHSLSSCNVGTLVLSAAKRSTLF